MELRTASNPRDVKHYDTDRLREEFLIQTALGFLHIKGSNLTLDKMDNENNELVIKGQIDSLSYVNNQKGKEGKGNIFKKLLK